MFIVKIFGSAFLLLAGVVFLTIDMKRTHAIVFPLWVFSGIGFLLSLVWSL